MTVFQERPGLLVAFRAGERAAMEAVFRRYADDVAGLVRWGCWLSGGRRLPGVPGWERELVQEVFARVFSPAVRASLDGDRPFRAFLLTIARNVLVDHWRRQKRHPEGAESPPDDVLPAEPLGMEKEEELYWKSCRQLTQEFVGGLSDLEKEFVTLRFEEEASQYDIMERLGLSRWRVRALEKSLIVSLTQHLDRAGMIER